MVPTSHRRQAHHEARAEHQLGGFLPAHDGPQEHGEDEGRELRGHPLREGRHQPPAGRRGSGPHCGAGSASRRSRNATLAGLDQSSAPITRKPACAGRLASPATPLQPRRPVELAPHLQAPVLGLYGGKDDGIPLDSVEQMKTALAQGSEAARRSQFHVYPDAPHAFHADYRPSFRAAEAQDGWKRCLAWFKQHGVA